MEFAVEGALDELYSAKPEDFTALRTSLAAEAKRRGDTDAARRIAASRKPTTAAWVVNAAALSGTVRAALADLGSRLREAHAAMDGEAIRALTAEQRKLVDELTRTGFRSAGIAAPTGALRDDVVATFQAAVADPDVAARLGRLTKAERWSGFGEFGSSAQVSTAPEARKVAAAPEARKPAAAPEARKPAAAPEARKPAAASEARKPAVSREARAALAAAERVKAEADAALAELQADLATARLRHQDARRRLADAEQAKTAAEDAYAAGKQASRTAAEALRAAKRAAKADS